ncbi:hypothetical protein LINGRAHAP2_LOCUS11306 [Linum grandiflorum]
MLIQPAQSVCNQRKYWNISSSPAQWPPN